MNNDPTTLLYLEYPSPIGTLVLTSDGQAITGLHLPDHHGHAPRSLDASWRRDPAPFRAAVAQLDAYFEGELRDFDLPLRMAGTTFQRQSWDALLTIPYGTTISYAEQARRIGREGAFRAVGAANGRNPVAIIVPCHRVIGTGGKLIGYGGGLPLKQWLLEHEATAHDRGARPAPTRRRKLQTAR
jgi:methylated-DNA-[protein]-cysteine S-methyltransferase